MANEQRDWGLPNYYELLNIPLNASRKDIKETLEKYKKNVRNSKELIIIEAAEEYLIDNKERYDKYLKNRGVKFPLSKKEKRKKIFKGTIIAGVIVAIGLSSTYYISEKKAENLNSNVCVEYQVQHGDTLNELREKYGLRDISMSYLAISGPQRQTAASNCGQDISGFLAEDDVIVARTTMEKADKFVEDKGASKKTIEEIKEDLKEENAVGEFEKAFSGDNNVDFYNLTTEKTLG